MINKRIFGADIPLKVKGVLEARQIVAESPSKANQSINLTNNIYSTTNPGNVKEHDLSEFLPSNNINFLNGIGGSLADLYSRTPFIRMWTAVALYQPDEYKESFGTGGIADLSETDQQLLKFDLKEEARDYAARFRSKNKRS